MKKYEAILWDCDGVLIDSEQLACGVVTSTLNHLGCPITLDEYIYKYAGKKYTQIFSDLKNEYGFEADERFEFPAIKTKQYEMFEAELKPTKGIETVLTNSGLPMAVASGSSLERLDLTLGVTNLKSYFKEHIYSSEQVENGKPSPDVFLFAAKQLGVNPEKCLVVEDSYNGVKAGLAAKMDVVAYFGGSHINDNYRNHVLSTGVNKSINDMLDLLKIIEA